MFFLLFADEKPVSFNVQNNSVLFLKILDKIMNFILPDLLSPHCIHIKSWHTQKKYLHGLFSDVIISMTAMKK